jgi:hypothetical protein
VIAAVSTHASGSSYSGSEHMLQFFRIAIRVFTTCVNTQAKIALKRKKTTDDHITPIFCFVY